MARILLLGGLDPSGGAGITLDAAVVMFHGAEPLPVALATTVQGLRGFVRSVPMDDAVLREQIDAVLRDGPVDAVKVGFVDSSRQVAVVAEILREQSLANLPVVVDPILSATAGGMGGADERVAAYREYLVPLATLVTPNVPELEYLASGDARELIQLGAHAVLKKGGHADGQMAIDELFVGLEQTSRYERKRFPCGSVRGTGCALASAIATRLANGDGVADACDAAGEWLGRVLQRVTPRGDGLPRQLPLDSRTS